jgi:hypothetical protein
MACSGMCRLARVFRRRYPSVPLCSFRLLGTNGIHDLPAVANEGLPQRAAMWSQKVKMLDTITLDGRTFSGLSQSISARQNDYVLGHLRETGAIGVPTEFDGKGARTREQKAQDLLTHILKSGCKNFILAGVLTEIGKKWSSEEANRNAALFAGITDGAEKVAGQTAIVKFVVRVVSSGEFPEIFELELKGLPYKERECMKVSARRN